jgi:hypothetical protein
MNRRYTRLRLPAVTRDRAAEHRADRVARGERPAVDGRVAEARAPIGLGLGSGEPLPVAELGYFERRLGADLSAVRVHPGAAVATALNANAFAAGRDIGLAPGRFRPGTREGRRLLGHELAHVLEQGASGCPALQLDGPPRPGEPELKLPDQEAAASAEAVGGGLETMAGVAKEDPVIKEKVIKPFEDYAKARFEALPGEAQGTLIGGSIAMYGGFLAAMLSNPQGRAFLSDFNLATPLTLVPYGTIDNLRFILPAACGAPVIFGGRLKGDDWLRLALGKAGDKNQFAPTMAVDFTWRYDPAAGDLSLSGSKLDIGLLPGLNLSAGAGVGLSWPTPATGPTGGTAWSMQSLPEGDPHIGPRGYGAFISLDLTQLPLVPPWLRFQLGGKPEK